MNELPNDAAALQALVLEQRELLLKHQETITDLQRQLSDKLVEIEQLKSQLAILKRQQFGPHSEKVKRQIQQIEEKLFELEEECIQQLAPVDPGVGVCQGSW